MKRTGEFALAAGTIIGIPTVWCAGKYDGTHKGFDVLQILSAVQNGVLETPVTTGVAITCFVVAAIDAVNSRRG